LLDAPPGYRVFAVLVPAAPWPRPDAVSFLHRFGSALNRHVHLHACVTDGVLVC
jgi:hypothetical protein